MELTEVVAVGIGGVLTLCTTLVTGYLGKRVSELEARNDELEEERKVDWKRERQLIGFIYRHNLVPPSREEIA